MTPPDTRTPAAESTATDTDRGDSAMPPRRTLRTALLALVAPPLLLLSVAGGLIVQQQWTAQRSAAQGALIEAADALRLAVERELAIETGALEAIAHSPLIDRGDLAGLHELGRRMAERRPGSLIALTDDQGQLLLNTAVPLGTPLPNLASIERENRHEQWQGESLPVSSRGLTRQARVSRAPAYSDLYLGVTIQRPTLAIAVPVLRNDTVPYTVTLSFPPDALNQVLAAQLAAGTYRALLLDGNARIVAATGEARAMIGRSAPGPLAELTRHAPDAGTGPRLSERSYLDGSTQVVAAALIAVSGWTVVLALDPDSVYRPGQRAILGWLAAVLAVVIGAWVLAARLAVQLGAPLRQITLRSMRTARRPDAEPAWPHSNVREIAQLADALRQAADLERERTEALLRRRVAEAREAEAVGNAEELARRETQLRLALAAGRLGFWQVDLKAGQVRGDALHAQLWGLPSGGVDVPTELLMERIDVHHRDEVRQKALIDPVQGSGHYEGEFLIHPRPGESRWLAAYADLLRDAQGEPVALIGVNTDITERRAIERRLRDQAEALQEAGRRKDHFLAMLGHELRNPLSPISMAAESLRAAPHDAERVRRNAEVIGRQVRHMVRLIDDLLDVARITQGKIQLRLGPVDLAAVLRDAVETTRPLLQARRHQLEVEPGPTADPQPLYVHGDMTRLVQVVVNLLTNAARYTDEGGRIRLRLAPAGPDDSLARIEVSDNGIGLAPEMLERVFDPFMQGSGERTQAGLGMGLAVVRRLVELHGGQVSARSDGSGQGATFEVTLPRVAPPAGAPGSAISSAGATAPRALRLLVVDDNQDSADSLAQLLTMLGHEVRVAYNASDALAVAPAFAPQAAILDIGLPDLDGRELAARLRQLPAGASMLLIAATGYGRLADGADAVFDHYLVKPVDVTQVGALLASHAAQRDPGASASSPPLAASSRPQA